MEKLYPCSFKCLTCVTVVDCVRFSPLLFIFFLFFYFSDVSFKYLVSLAHFPRFCWQCFSLSTTFSMHLARNTYFLLCSGFGIFLKCSVVLHAKSNRYLLKTAAIFLLNFVVQTALIWLVLVGFFCFFSQSETIWNLHSCYRRTALLSQPIRNE